MIYILFLFSLIIAVLYALLIGKYLDGWVKTDKLPINRNFSLESVSVIIAAKNEEKNIKSCLDSILKSNYPKELLQIIVVENNSTDSTFSVASSIQDDRILVIQSKKGFKKEAVEIGISVASTNAILLTDADCVVGINWVKEMTYPLFNEGKVFVLGPVKISKYRNVWERFQAMDMLAMMGITAGGLHQKMTYLANGANMAFSKIAFQTIGEIPRKDLKSGDDVFLLHEFIKKFPEKIAFQKSTEAIVLTNAISKFGELIQQRIRWASKSTSYINSHDRYAAAFIFIFCLSILMNFLLIPFTSGFSFFIALFQLFIKGTIDFAFLVRINEFFHQKRLLKYFLPSFVIHFIYILFSGFSGLIGLKYKWKE